LSTYRSPLYRLWVIGGLVGIVAFAVIGGLSDPSNQDFVLYLIPVVAIWVFGILFLQWRGLRRDEAEQSDSLGWQWSSWNLRFAVVLCIAIFAGVFLFYAGVDKTFYPLGAWGPGLPLPLIPAVALAFLGAGRTLKVLRDVSR
jgi:peptidoglycan/LPS O-acetylase OafA/YrhL